ncbi:MAG: S8 family serine peptidase [Roseibium sp.]
MNKEAYPVYDALWPLVAMKVLTEDHKPNGWTPAPAPQAATRVAVIDTSVAADHPNLKAAINRNLAFDLFSTRLGAFPYRGPAERVGQLDLNTSTNVTSGQPHSTALLNELIDRLSAESTCWLGKVQPTAAPEFSSHGTAICGLVGARPAIADTADGHPAPVPGATAVPLPFTGVDPHCEIVPISTNFDPTPESLILAFLYAELINADIILLPRTIPDPFRTPPELTEKIGDIALRDLVAPVEISEEEEKAWHELAQLISNISLSRPVVCAGGNGQEDAGIYPANLASEHNGVIAVGAVNAKGYRSGYAPLRGMTIVGPSDDSETFDRTEVRQDTLRHDYTGEGVPSANANAKFSHFDVISTDVPGAHGYSGSPFQSPEEDGELREFGSYFCRFGGTSASSALVAGFLSLAKSSGALAKTADGLDAKAWLLGKCASLNEGGEQYPFPVWDDGEPNFPDPASPPA